MGKKEDPKKTPSDNEENVKQERTITERLSEKFHPDDVEWVIVNARDIKGRNGIFIKAYAQPYIKKESSEQRMDTVLGCDNWENDFQMPDDKGRIKYEIRYRDPENQEWIYKRSGSSIDLNAKGNFASEAFEIALTYAEKRVFSKVGIGRYLRLIQPIQVEISEKYQEGWEYYQFRSKIQFEQRGSKKVGKKVSFYWKPPALPASALPEGVTPKDSAEKSTETSPPPPEKKMATKKQWGTIMHYWNNLPEEERELWQSHIFKEEVDEETGEVVNLVQPKMGHKYAASIIDSLKKGYGDLNDENIPESFASKKKASESFTHPEGDPSDEEVRQAREAAQGKK